jgi:uncharacterized protein (DUF885 family)
VTEAEQFRQVAGAALDDLLADNPERATDVGDHRFDDRLTDRTVEGRRAARDRAAAHRSALAAVDTTALDPEDAVDATVLAGVLDREVFAIDELAEHTWNPLAYNLGEALHPLLTREVPALPDRLRSIAARLDAFADVVATARRQLVRPPHVHVETALLQHAGTVGMVRDEVSRLLAGEPGLRGVVEPAQQRALAALAEHEEHLRELIEGEHRDFRLGADRFDRKLRLTLQSPLSPADVLSRAQASLAEVTEQLYAVARDHLGRGGEPAEIIRTALDDVARDHPDDTTIVGAARQALADCTDAVRRLGIVTIPDDPVRVEVMPEFRRGVAVAYCDPPGPLEPVGTTSFAISPTPADWSPERVASFYREYNSAMVVDLAVHEAMPGHVLQLATARRFAGSTPLRAAYWSGSFVEGWAVHAERIMAEAGHGGTPVRLQQLKMQLRMTINAILDAGVHAGELAEAEALDLMTRRGFQEEGEAVGKWRRARLTSAQLSTYFVGYTELADLFADLGSLSSYDAVLAHGSPPPAQLRRLLLP